MIQRNSAQIAGLSNVSPACHWNQASGCCLSTAGALLLQLDAAGGPYLAAVPHGLGARASRLFFQY